MTGGDLAAELTGFANALRAAGLKADLARLGLAARALLQLGPRGRAGIYWATRLAFCSRRDDLPVFDAVFGAWFGEPVPLVAVQVPGEGAAPPPAGGAPVPGTATAADEPTPVGTAGWAERDLTELAPAERAEANAWIAALRPRPGTRRAVRQVPGGRHRVDLGRTARAMLRTCGEPARLRYRRRTRRPRRLVLLIDVSLSVAAYADPLLRFAHAAVRTGPATTEVFTVGTGLVPITAALRTPDPEAALGGVLALRPRGGGTRLGAGLADLLRPGDRRRAVRSAVVVIASDGWDHGGQPAVLIRRVARLSRLAYRLVWVNPLAGRHGHVDAAPVLRHGRRDIHEVVPGHSYAALRSLAELVSRR
ncbi:VWA domain-containing protein [Phytohabitans rumicis]|uniref:VWA domain-containing protein n=1 Tax=Phytohabitans rumicis TaxID=1076125 RepID=A0A6V8LU06_9ACTN|nr:VWA domain-containing protein [Phytohabitans rumicis]GFJ96245.1 VWA domain-containing protein [Phytohabitans rumicis]